MQDNLQAKLTQNIVDELFFDADRPFKQGSELEEKVEEQHHWEQYKQGLREQKIK